VGYKRDVELSDVVGATFAERLCDEAHEYPSQDKSRLSRIQTLHQNRHFVFTLEEGAVTRTSENANQLVLCE